MIAMVAGFMNSSESLNDAFFKGEELFLRDAEEE